MLRTFAWDVGQELDRLHQEVNRLLGSSAGGGAAERPLSPAMRAEESEKGWWLAFDMPGVPADGLEVEIQDKILRIRGARTEPGFRAQYERTLTLPQESDTEAVRAEHRDGVLRLFVPKREQVRPRRVEVQSGNQQRHIETESEQREMVGSAS